jgi:DNA-binding response OmpR family regulator
VDLRRHVVMLDGQVLTLNRTEDRLLGLLVEHAGEVVPRPILLMVTRTADMHMRRLRKKLGMHADQYIEAVVGVGYRFRPLPRR